MKLTRRNFIKFAGIAGLAGLVGELAGCSEKTSVIKSIAQADKLPPADTARVYFSKHIDAEHLIALYQKINSEITGKVGIKVHTGEPNGPNILSRDMVKAFQAQIPNSAIIETNTLYAGARSTTEKHRRTLKVNGWTFCPVDILDEEGDVNFPVKNGFHLSEVAMGSHLTNYDSLIVLTHFKGHSMGGFGGSLKNIAIGMASGHVGKVAVHGYNTALGMPPINVNWMDGTFPLKEELMERMADSGKATCDYFGKRIVFLNVMRRMSVDCDCAGTHAAEPTCADVGILASTDILAIDQACCDLVYTANDTKDLRERIESRHGLRQLSAMAEHKMGNSQYELISVD